MDNSDHNGSLELEVSNFGPIVEAKVDLRPFTVFVGPSNTGKSYLAILIYALHRFFSRPQYSGYLFRRKAKTILYSLSKQEELLSDDAIYNVFDWVQRTFRETEETPNGFPDTLPENIAALIRPVFETIGGSVASIEAEITRCFGIQSTSELIRNPGTNGIQIFLRRYNGIEQECEHPFVYQLDITKQKPARLFVSIPAEQPLKSTVNIGRLWRIGRGVKFEGFEEQEKLKFLVSGLISDLIDAIFPFIVGPASFPAHYLPADRTGVMHAHRVVVSALIESATRAGIHQASQMPMLSGVLADFLEQLIELGNIPHDRRKQEKDLAVRLEKTILGGSIRLEKNNNLMVSYPSFSYLPNGWKDSLPLMRTSSMVSELAPVVLYLRHVVQPGELLIIEEPESHLHPALQVEFTRLLAAAVRAGVRIILTTHSEWVLEELANLVRMSALPKTERKGIDGGDVVLSAHEVGAWLFQPKERPKGSIVQEIPLDWESGTFASGYDEVAAVLHNRWAEISSRSEENEE